MGREKTTLAYLSLHNKYVRLNTGRMQPVADPLPPPFDTYNIRHRAKRTAHGVPSTPAAPQPNLLSLYYVMPTQQSSMLYELYSKIQAQYIHDEQTVLYSDIGSGYLH